MTARVSTRVQCSRAWTDFLSISTGFTYYLNSRLGYPEPRWSRLFQERRGQHSGPRARQKPWRFGKRDDGSDMQAGDVQLNRMHRRTRGEQVQNVE
jgi:hypothetical protein